MVAQVKIAYFVDSFNIGGTELNAIRSAQSLDRDEFEIVVYHLTDRGPLRQRYEELGIELIHTPISNLYSARTALQAVEACRDLRRRKIDVVHSHDIYSNIFIATWARLITSGTVICSRRWGPIASDPRLQWVNRQASRFAHAILTNSRAIGEFIATHEGVPKRKIRYVPNFVDDNAFEIMPDEDCQAMRRRWGVPEDAYVVGSVSRLVPVKNLRLLLDAAPAIDSGGHFVIVGDGPCRPELENRAKRNGVYERVHFVGEMIAPENLHSYFDLSVSCSHSEGFPNSLIEAMAAGRPVVATNVGGVPDAVEDQVTGLLVEADSRERFVEAVNRMIRNPTLSSRCGMNARRVASSKFSRDVVIAELQSIYRHSATARN